MEKPQNVAVSADRPVSVAGTRPVTLTGRIPVTEVEPVVEGGSFPAKAVVGETPHLRLAGCARSA